MSTPLVSVIIPCYRQGRFLTDTVNTALALHYPRLEIVVVNDGSDDDTDTVARGFGERIVYVSKPNGGLASARNAGIRAATGEYLYFLDADDSLHPSALRWLVDAAEAGGGCTAMMGYRTFEQHGQWLGGEDAPEGDSLFPWLLVRNYPVHCWLMLRRLALAVNGFDEAMVTHEDHEFWVRVAAVDPRMRRVAERGAYYRQHPGSMSRSHTRMGMGRLRLLMKTTDIVTNDPELALKHGAMFLRHLYVMRLVFVAQTPELERAELDRCIVNLHRAGVRWNGKPLDWCYALLPKPLLQWTDRVLLSLLKWVAPRKHAELHGTQLNPTGRRTSSH